MSFISAMADDQNRDAYTENGALTLRSTKSDLLDFFSQAGAFRSRSDDEIIQAFSKAFAEDKLLAMKTLFYIRDVRGGQGERRVFRVIWKWLVENQKTYAEKNIINVPFYGRWDDLFFDISLIDFSKQYLNSIVIEVLANDIDDKPQSFEKLGLFKWLPSINTSSKETVARAKKMAKALGYRPSDYRKLLSSFRKELDIVERKMSAKDWTSIKYEKVPSRASLLYRKAFYKNDNARYSNYIDRVKSGEAKINASVTYPYEIVRELFKKRENDEVLNAIWSSLPDYIGDGGKALVLADVSGSMSMDMVLSALPLHISISLALYMAERNTDPAFGGYFMTFSHKPELVKVVGDTIYDKIVNISQADWNGNTNLNLAFQTMLDTAKKHSLPKEDMPKRLIIVSDMEFDIATGNETNFEAIKRMYSEAGYEMPTLVFWNVASRNSQSPVEMNEKGVMLVSGASPSIFKNLLASKTTTPYELMLEVISAERYERVVI